MAEKTYTFNEKDLQNIIKGFNVVGQTLNNIGKVFASANKGMHYNASFSSSNQSSDSHETGQDKKREMSEKKKRDREHKEHLRDLNQEMTNNFADYLNEYEFVTEKSRKLFKKGIEEYNKSTANILLNSSNSVLKQLKNQSTESKKLLDRLSESIYDTADHDLRVKEKILKAKIDSHPLLNPSKFIGDAITKGFSITGTKSFGIMQKISDKIIGKKSGLSKLMGIGKDWSNLPGEVLRTQEKQRKHIIDESSPEARRASRASAVREAAGKYEKGHKKEGEYKLSQEESESQVIMSEMNEEQKEKLAKKTESLLKRRAKANKKSLTEKVSMEFKDVGITSDTPEGKASIDKKISELESAGVSSGKRFNDYVKLQRKYQKETEKAGGKTKEEAYSIAHEKAVGEVKEKYEGELDPQIGITMKELLKLVAKLTEEGTKKGSIYVADAAVKDELIESNKLSTETKDKIDETNKLSIDTNKELDKLIDVQPSEADKFKAGLHGEKGGKASGIMGKMKEGILGKAKAGAEGGGIISSLLKEAIGPTLTAGLMSLLGIGGTAAGAGAAATVVPAAATAATVTGAGTAATTAGTVAGTSLATLAIPVAAGAGAAMAIQYQKNQIAEAEAEAISPIGERKMQSKMALQKQLKRAGMDWKIANKIDYAKDSNSLESSVKEVLAQIKSKTSADAEIKVDETTPDTQRLQAEEPVETINNIKSEEQTNQQQEIMIKQQQKMIKQNEELINKPPVISRTYLPSPNYNNPMQQMGVA